MEKQGGTVFELLLALIKRNMRAYVYICGRESIAWKIKLKKNYTTFGKKNNGLSVCMFSKKKKDAIVAPRGRSLEIGISEDVLSSLSRDSSP